MKPIFTPLLLCLSYLFALSSFAYAQEIDPLQAPISQRTISDNDIEAIAELHVSVESGDFKAIQKCLDAGAPIDGVLGKTSYRVLHKAAKEGSIEMVKFLIERGAMVNARAEYGWTPLDMAIKKNRKKVIELLRSNGGKTDFELTDKTSVTWLKMRLNTYKVDIGHFPTAKEGGLTALVNTPSFEEDAMMEKWKGPYLKEEKAMVDEWGRRLNYNAGKRDFDLFSSGPDGKPKTKDDEIYSRSFDFLFEPKNK
jgi:type II secretion system protein G